MSMLSAVGYSVCHVAATAAAATWLGRMIFGLLSPPRDNRRTVLLWAALLAPLLTPPLLVGYAYSDYALELIRHRLLNAVFYAALMVIRMAPIAALVFYFAPPPPLSVVAIHCAKLAQGCASQSSRHAWRSAIGPVARAALGTPRNTAFAFALVFLLAFQEFEIASLMGIQTWTVWLFEAQTGGLAIWSTLTQAALPLTCELFVLVPLLIVLLRNQRLPTPADRHPQTWRRGAQAATRAYLVLAVFSACSFPAWVVMQRPMDGLMSLRANLTLRAELTSLVFAITASLIALTMVWFLVRPTRGRVRDRIRTSAAITLCLPGLLGSLMLGLVMLALFQQSPLSAWYDTPVPLLSALVLLLTPPAALLGLLMGHRSADSSVFLAERLRAAPSADARRSGRRLLWMLRGRATFWIAALLCLYAYFDLSASYLLAPSGQTPVTVRLYNQMHFGQNAAMSAMVCVAVGAFIMMVLIARGAVSTFHHWTAHD